MVSLLFFFLNSCLRIIILSKFIYFVVCLNVKVTARWKNKENKILLIESLRNICNI